MLGGAPSEEGVYPLMVGRLLSQVDNRYSTNSFSSVSSTTRLITAGSSVPSVGVHSLFDTW